MSNTEQIPVPDDVVIPPLLDEEDDPRQKAICAFVVIIDEDGRALATSEIERALGAFVTRREADMGDIERACSEVARGVGRMLSAEALMQVQMAMVEEAKKAKANPGILKPDGSLLLP